jgi:coenzyme F420-0:L-glutamate ligase / coenzyme F420-1:gamma-L-glutamate ligase
MAISLHPVSGIPRVRPGDDLATLLVDGLRSSGLTPVDGDVLVVCQKVVSKAEGRSARIGDVTPSPLALEVAAAAEDRDPRVAELVLRNSKRIVMMKKGHLIVETGPGWVCANAGIDASNTGDADSVLLLPEDPDASAAALATALGARFAADLAVVISDTWGRPWRVGLVDFAIGVAGLNPLRDLRGGTDMDGRELHHTVNADADALTAAAGLLMSKDSGVPAVLVRGYQRAAGTGTGRDLIRDADTDLFR